MTPTQGVQFPQQPDSDRRSAVNGQNTCYACDKPATTKEHAPPFSFFPEGHRTNLITVPSCPDHNTANSKDVEYTRNVITTMFGVNQVGESHFSDKSVRSFDRSPALLQTTFSDIRALQLRGQTIGAFTVNTQRVEEVMKACVRALHFRETGEKRPDWVVILPNLIFRDGATDEAQAQWLQLLSAFGQMAYTKRPTNAPDVFEYAVAEIPGGLIYSMRFFKGFLVFAMGRA
jgi:hypothetical protein